MERDTRRLALLSVGLGIGIVTMLPVKAGLAQGFRPVAPYSLAARLLGNLRVTDAPDVLLNVLLFLPWGYFAAAAAAASASASAAAAAAAESGGSPKTESRRRRIWMAALSGLALSVFLEGIQLWIPGRFSSLSDVLMNGLGSALGGWAAVAAPLGDSG